MGDHHVSGAKCWMKASVPMGDADAHETFSGQEWLVPAQFQKSSVGGLRAKDTNRHEVKA
jgi:hypothetical protein